MDTFLSGVELLARYDVALALLIGSVGGVIIGAIPGVGPAVWSPGTTKTRSEAFSSRPGTCSGKGAETPRTPSAVALTAKALNGPATGTISGTAKLSEASHGP